MVEVDRRDLADLDTVDEHGLLVGSPSLSLKLAFSSYGWPSIARIGLGPQTPR